MFILVEMSGASSSSSAKAEVKASPKATAKATAKAKAMPKANTAAKAKAKPGGKREKPTEPVGVQESRSPGIPAPTAQPAGHGKGKARGKAAATHADAAGAPPAKRSRAVVEEPVEEATEDQDEMVLEDDEVVFEDPVDGTFEGEGAEEEPEEHDPEVEEEMVEQMEQELKAPEAPKDKEAPEVEHKTFAGYRRPTKPGQKQDIYDAMVQQFYDVVALASEIKNRTKEQPIFREYFVAEALKKIEAGEPLTGLGEAYLAAWEPVTPAPPAPLDDVPETQLEEDTQMEPAESQATGTSTQSHG